MAAGTGDDGGFIKFKLSVTPSCENGAGKVVCNVVTDSSESVQFSIIGETNNYSANATVAATAHTFTQVPDGTYSVFASLLQTSQGNDSQSGVAITCGLVDFELCDLEITSVEVTESRQTVASGTAKINVTRTGTKSIEFKVDDLPWSFFENFTALTPGLHTAYVRYKDNTLCFDDREFTIPSPYTVGCTNPEADNWNKLANEDDGSCTYTPKVFATGGTLPNPVYIPVSFPTLVQGVVKSNHYVKINIYQKDEAEPFATVRQTLRNGEAQVDISTYLRNRMRNDLLVGSLVIGDNPKSYLPFYVGVIECYNGQAQAEVKRVKPDRFAVNAALQDYPGNIQPYVLQPDTAVLRDFMYTISDPVLIEGYHQSVSLFVRPDAPQPLYFQRRYMDIRKQDVEIRSTLIPAYLYGTRIYFNLLDPAILCAEWLEVTIETEQNLLTGICEVVPNEDGIFDFTYDNTYE